VLSIGLYRREHDDEQGWSPRTFAKGRVQGVNPSFATGLIAPSCEAFCNCIPTDPRSSWYSSVQRASEVNPKRCVPANTASIKTESSSAVHLELVAISSVEYLANVGRVQEREPMGVPPFYVNLHRLVIHQIPRGAPVLCQNNGFYKV